MDMFEKHNQTLRKKARINDIACFTVAIFYSAATLLFTAQPCFSDNSILSYSRASATIMFLILGIGFLIAGVTMLLSLK